MRVQKCFHIEFLFSLFFSSILDIEIKIKIDEHLNIKVEYTEYKSWYHVVYNNVMCNKTIIFQPIKTNMYTAISTFDKSKINFAINSMIIFKTYFTVLLLLLFILKIAIP
jgi:hypothetical protein